ncbi:hypothetical protein AMATHDRAFT_149189 [Amanita thiersii Skay4041]|uniref:Uncharacterized protein n=1 Tax=Amanita thiersii Skay4041 TaxID=703135 RepID=A0A2A9NCI6_9AGAR|nr:hypothetical protein AMATHDRAFT_149189 [Amanita thiersii Skay4041]
MSLPASEIRRVSRRTVEALERLDYECCLFGSAACHLWGMAHRVPNDIDIVVLTDDDPEEIKAKLEELDDSRFRLIPAQDPRKHYKVLWYVTCWEPRIECKVDIVTPNTRRLNIPDVPRDLIPWMSDIPVMPFLPLLLLKVLGWHGRHTSNKLHLQKKIPRDEADIINLLDLLDAGDKLYNNRWLRTTKLRLMRSARVHIGSFAKKFPSTKRKWKYIGFRFN